MIDFESNKKYRESGMFSYHAYHLIKLLDIRTEYIESKIWAQEPEKYEDFERALYTLIIEESEDVAKEGELLKPKLSAKNLQD